MLGFPMSFFPPFSAEFPSGAWRLTMSTFVLASKICKKESPRRGTLRYSNGRRWPNVEGASSIIGFPRNQVIQPPFLRLNFLLYYFFLI